LKPITSSFHLQTNLRVQDDGGRAGEPGSKWHMNSNMYFAFLCVVSQHVLKNTQGVELYPGELLTHASFLL
jgi:hypothetical protein